MNTDLKIHSVVHITTVNDILMWIDSFYDDEKPEPIKDDIILTNFLISCYQNPENYEDPDLLPKKVKFVAEKLNKETSQTLKKSN